MPNWYSAATPDEQERLVGAWPDAPVHLAELCGMLLEVAREQVENYAPAAVLQEVAPVAPVTLTLPDGATLVLTRMGDVVTAFLTTITADPGDTEIPAEFGGGRFHYSADPAGVLPQVYRWVTEIPADGGIPSRLVYAQLQQACNLWNAGRVDGGGEAGTDGYSFTPRPLDKTIRGIIRPIDGKLDVL